MTHAILTRCIALYPRILTPTYSLTTSAFQPPSSPPLTTHPVPVHSHLPRRLQQRRKVRQHALIAALRRPGCAEGGEAGRAWGGAEGGWGGRRMHADGAGWGVGEGEVRCWWGFGGWVGEGGGCAEGGCVVVRVWDWGIEVEVGDGHVLGIERERLGMVLVYLLCKEME